MHGNSMRENREYETDLDKRLQDFARLFFSNLGKFAGGAV